MVISIPGSMQALSELQSHYLFAEKFGRPGKGNDKGKVEGLVGYARRFLAPIPRAESWEELNTHLLEQCGKRRERRSRGQEETLGECYHSGAVLVETKSAEVRTYIPEKKQKGHRHWEGTREQQQAVYADQRRVNGAYEKHLLRKRGELVERSFAHCYDTGGIRRTHLREHENILKRLLIHVGAFNLSLIFRTLLGVS
jgi:hypothetical protein